MLLQLVGVNRYFQSKSPVREMLLSWTEIRFPILLSSGKCTGESFCKRRTHIIFLYLFIITFYQSSQPLGAFYRTRVLVRYSDFGNFEWKLCVMNCAPCNERFIPTSRLLAKILAGMYVALRVNFLYLRREVRTYGYREARAVIGNRLPYERGDHSAVPLSHS